ncbi:MAG: alpha/beta hydrolase [Burkholderiales bacterium]|nr:alpha/beta hydrolase [Burkholderiales bacterium]
MLDVDVRRLLDVVNARKMRAYDEMTPQEARVSFKASRFSSQPDPQDVAHVDDFTISGPHGEIQVRSYRPLGARLDEVIPALVYYHGGGFTIGDLDTHDSLCRELCNLSGVAIFSVNYRKGPECKFPAAHDDAYAALRWVIENAAKMRINPDRIAVGGDSSGGNLATVSAIRLRDEGGPPLAFQLLIYPGTDFRFGTPSHERNGHDYMLTKKTLDYFCACYLNSDEDKLDWRMSPTLAPNLAGLPPALILSGGFDPLVDENEIYAQRLKEAGVTVEYVCYSGQIHGFITMGRIIKQANEAVALCADRLRALQR